MKQSAEQRRLRRTADGFNRKAARVGAPGVVTAIELFRLPHRCAYCGIGLEDGQGSFDHRVAFANGGRNEIENIVRCCTTCNREKFTKTPDELERHRGLRVTCPIDGTVFQPRWAEYQRGMARYCSRACAAKSRWV